MNIYIYIYIHTHTHTHMNISIYVYIYIKQYHKPNDQSSVKTRPDLGRADTSRAGSGGRWRGFDGVVQDLGRHQLLF